MAIIGLIICLFLLVISYILWKDFTAPTFILSLEWTLMYFLLVISFRVNEINNIFYLCFSFGLMFFIIGFLLSYRKRKNKSVKKEPLKEYIMFNRRTFIVLFTVQFVIVLLIVLKLRTSLKGFYVDNLWYSVRNASKYGTYESGSIIERLQLFVVAFPLVNFAIYVLNPQKRNRNCFILTFLTSLPVIFTMNRGGMIMVFLAMIFIFLNIKNYSNAKIAKWGIIVFVTIIIIFSITSIWKFFNIPSLQNDPVLILKYSFQNYFITSMINFVEWAENNDGLLYGKNTFRFILAIANFLGFNVDVPGTVQEFKIINIGSYDLISNVYTMLHYYARDFGIWYALLIEFFLGFVYGFLYKKSNFGGKTNLFYTIILSLMMFPLFSQFFDDTYFSRFSTWLQYFLWIWFFTRRKICIVADKVTEQNITSCRKLKLN
ncbi:MAG TPA: hypothetical protein DCM73_02150 [Clostridiales bacterium]|nr:hypothetical protein [Clostridiales bacterium]